MNPPGFCGTKNTPQKNPSRDALTPVYLCHWYNVIWTGGGSGNQFYTTLMTTENCLPQKRLISISSCSPHFGFPGVSPLIILQHNRRPDRGVLLPVWISGCTSCHSHFNEDGCGLVYPPHPPNSFFPVLFLLLQGSSSFLPPYSVEKDECFLPDFSLHAPFKVPETWGNTPNRGKLWVFILERVQTWWQREPNLC